MSETTSDKLERLGGVLEGGCDGRKGQTWMEIVVKVHGLSPARSAGLTLKLAPRHAASLPVMNDSPRRAERLDGVRTLNPAGEAPWCEGCELT